jgi:hypothetical protein
VAAPTLTLLLEQVGNAPKRTRKIQISAAQDAELVGTIELAAAGEAIKVGDTALSATWSQPIRRGELKPAHATFAGIAKLDSMIVDAFGHGTGPNQVALDVITEGARGFGRRPLRLRGRLFAGPNGAEARLGFTITSDNRERAHGIELFRPLASGGLISEEQLVGSADLTHHIGGWTLWLPMPVRVPRILHGETWTFTGHFSDAQQ